MKKNLAVSVILYTSSTGVDLDIVKVEVVATVVVLVVVRFDVTLSDAEYVRADSGSANWEATPPLPNRGQSALAAPIDIQCGMHVLIPVIDSVVVALVNIMTSEDDVSHKATPPEYIFREFNPGSVTAVVHVVLLLAVVA